MARKNPIARQASAARVKTAQKKAAYNRKKNEVEKLEGKKSTPKRQREIEQIKRREKIDTKRNKVQSLIILCACGLAAIIMSNWEAISSALGIG